MTQQAFREKWEAIHAAADNRDERSIYVEPGDTPRTQRQLSLYHYFRFVERELRQAGAMDVIEIGCGRGTLATYLAEYCGLRVSLMDNEPAAIAIAREAFAARQLTAHFHVGDAVTSGLPDASFDAVVSIGLAEHLDDVRPLFAEQFRLLRPGGVMVSLNIPKKFSVQHLNVALRRLKKLAGAYRGDVRQDYYRNTFTAREYAAFARDVGFSETSITHVCPFPIYVPIRVSTDRAITTIRRAILGARRLWMPYPYKTNALIAHSHFLVARKPARR